MILNFNVIYQGGKLALCKVGDLDRVTIITLIEQSDLYKKGLQRNYKDLVDLDEVGDSLATLLTNMICSGILDNASYSCLLSSVVKYVESNKPFSLLAQFMGIVEDRPLPRDFDIRM